MKKNKVLLIGWDAADWKIINPLMDAGMMPALESMVNNGVMGNLATLDPPLSPMLWTSISTSKRADKHGILGFTEPAPDGKGIRPVMITSRKVKAIWNILSQAGYKTNVIGWWPSHPAEPINGISISNFYSKVTAEYGKEWLMAPGTVHPKSKEEIFKKLRLHPGELTVAHILPFVPDASKVDQENDNRLGSIAKITADCSTIHAAATYILENEEWDFTAVYFDAIDHYCHGFMKFHPPKMNGVPEELFDLYKGVVEGGYIYHDMMLSTLLELAGEDTTVILISDHGFHSDHLRLKSIPQEPAGPAWEHRNYGIFVMKGPGIIKDERIYGANLLDITPTILTLFDLPIGKDMEGKPLLQAFKKLPQHNYIESWEEIDGESGMHPNDIQRDPIAEQAAMNQLIELGYIEKPDDNIQKRLETTIDESKFYLARVLMSKNKFSEAKTILEGLYKKHPIEVRYAFQLAKCYDGLGRINDASDLVKKIIHFEEVERPFIEYKEKEMLRKKKIEELRKEEKDIPKELIKETPKPSCKKAAYPQLFLLKGTLELARKNFKGALLNLNKAEKGDEKLPQLYQQIGKVYLRMRRPNDAIRAFLKELDNDPENPHAHFGLAQVCFRKRNYELAAEYSLNTVGLLYHFPQAHLLLGMSLAKLAMYNRAVEALRVALLMAPKLIAAHKYLAYIYEFQFKDKLKADEHIREIKKIRFQENEVEK